MISGLTNISYLQERLPEAKIYWKRSEFEPITDFSIINVNKDPDEIGHWVLIYKNYYLDSFGLPIPDDVAKKIFKKYDSIHVNTFKIQYKNSENCGNYCLYFANLIKEGHTPLEIIESQH